MSSSSGVKTGTPGEVERDIVSIEERFWTRKFAAWATAAAEMAPAEELCESVMSSILAASEPLQARSGQGGDDGYADSDTSVTE